ncbi:MAG: thioredoxin domain-containing protein [Planctomycetota bacterium]|nr:thioredoxin domain-containing protein [Planctomycetota bacterium]
MQQRLRQSPSTYLRQHAEQPVDWWPWSEEAFAEARRRDVPLLVSIGYATCHWCHVMAHESFADPETAALMNAALVSIKVDREEHPEVDAFYMDAVQALSGHGGWPLNAFVDHQGRPFFAVTYLPRPSWQRLVREVARAWHERRAQLLASAAQLTAHLCRDESAVGALAPNIGERFRSQLAAAYDAEHPGLAWSAARAPKFPPSCQLHLLLSGAAEEAAIAEAILAAMQDSGLHDRVGGGFHRYSVDRQWRVPHFEKMLYDNALLIGAYARAHLRTGRRDFLATAVNAADYLLRELRVYEGGRFLGYAAGEDADDPRGEGAFYAWTRAELCAALGEEAGTRLAREWDLHDDEPQEPAAGGHREPLPGRIPHPRGSGLDLEPLRAGWESSLPILRARRAARPRPIRDELVLTDWNGLALEGLAWVARASGEARHSAAVRELADALWQRRSPQGLLHLPGRPALVTDYGALACGLLAAFDALGDPELVARASALLAEAEQRLRAADGGFYVAPAESPLLLRRGREPLDNAWPSGEAQLALAAARLWHLTGDASWRALGEAVLASAARSINELPLQAATALRAQRALARGGTVVVRGSALLAAARRCPDDALAIVPLAAGAAAGWACAAGHALPGPDEAWVCRGGRCLSPVPDAATLAAQLNASA